MMIRSGISLGRRFTATHLLVFLSVLSVLIFCSSKPEKGGDMKRDPIVREPAFAGSFYPSGRDELLTVIDSFLEEAEVPTPSGTLLWMIVPHAGYSYSGMVAAHAFQLLKERTFSSVILLGPSHRSVFDGAAIYPEGTWKTPLGLLHVDDQLATSLLAQDDAFRPNPMVHRNEHSLEVQLPFLKYVAPDIKIVPVMIAESNPEILKRLGTVLAEVLRDRTDVLLLASSDLYHGYSYKNCLDTDKLTLSYIERLDPEGLIDALSTRRAQACGGGPVAVVLHAALQLGADKAELLTYTNSADVTKDRSGYVVGYSAWAILRSNEPADDKGGSFLKKEEKSELLAIARTSVEAKLQGKPIPRFSPESRVLNEKCGAFVTLTKDSRLRGCIGYILPIKPLHETVSDAAIQAAIADPRFPPVAEEELSQVDIEISVLTPLIRVDDPLSVEVGRHGLYIKKGMQSGLLLPQVASEHQWDRKTFLEQTCRKAGLPQDAWREGAEIYVFSAEVFGEEER